MKILLTAHQFLPEFSSGTEVLTFEVARELVRLGHDVRVLTGWPGTEETPRDDEYVYEGIRVHRYYAPPVATTSMEQRTRAEFDNPAIEPYLEGFVAQWMPELVHFVHIHRLTSAIVDFFRARSIPTVYTATDFWAICPMHQLRLPDGGTCDGPSDDSANCVLHLALHGRRSSLAPLYPWIPTPMISTALRFPALRRQAAPGSALAAAFALQHRPERMRRMLGELDRIVAPTQFMMDRLVRFGAPAARVRRIAYGVDTTLYADVQPIATSGPLRIGFIGTLSSNKGAHVLVQAVRLIDPAQDFTVEIYGDETFFPDYVAGLKTTAGDDPRITFRGPFLRQDFARKLDRLDVLVVPSTWSENTPLVIYAAQSAGRPVVGSDVAGIAEVVTNGKNGRLFEAANASSLASILVELISDRATVAALAAQAQPPKDMSQYAAELLALYDEVLVEREGIAETSR